MHLDVKDVARILRVSDKTIYRWIKQGVMPAYRINDQYRIHRMELMQWVTARKIPVSQEIFREPEADVEDLSLASALEGGGILYRVGGNDKESAIHEVVNAMRLPEEVDRDFLKRVLLAREDLCPTAVGDGIAIPHPRNPIVLHVNRATVTLCFLEQPVAFGAIDGKPVHALFTLVSPTTRAHLNLLSRLSYALRTPEFKELIVNPGKREEILTAAHEADRVFELRMVNR